MEGMTNKANTDSSDDRQRDRQKTELLIISAGKTVLAEQGFGGWGVNAIARVAGCDKQLIYRYFDGLDGLAAAIGLDVAAELVAALSKGPVSKPQSYAELVAMLLDEFFEVLRANLVMQRIIAWEMSASNPLTVRFAKARGEALGMWVAKARGSLTPPAGIDAPAMNAGLIAAVQHLVLSGGANGSFAGMPLAAEADWQRARSAIRQMVFAIYSLRDESVCR